MGNVTEPLKLVLAKQISRWGGDGGWLRRCALSNTGIGLTVHPSVANFVLVLWLVHRTAGQQLFDPVSLLGHAVVDDHL